MLVAVRGARRRLGGGDGRAGRVTGLERRGERHARAGDGFAGRMRLANRLREDQLVDLLVAGNPPATREDHFGDHGGFVVHQHLLARREIHRRHDHERPRAGAGRELQRRAAGRSYLLDGQYFRIAHNDRSALHEAIDGGHLEVGRAGRGGQGEVLGALDGEVVLVVVQVRAVREAARAEGSDGGSRRAEAAGGVRDRREVAGLLRAGIRLVAFAQVRIHDEAVVERIGHVALRVAEGDVAGALGEGRAAEQEVRLAGEAGGAAHNGLVDGMGRLERLLEFQREAEREDRLVAVVRELRRGFEGDTRAAHAVRHVGGVGELQRLGDVQARARILVRAQRAVQRVARGRRAHGRNRHSLDAVSLAIDVQPDAVAHGNVRRGGDLDVGVAGFCVHGQIPLGAGLAHLGHGHDLVLLEDAGDGGPVRTVADGHLLAHGEVRGGRDGEAGRSGRVLDAVPARERLPQRGGRAGRLEAAPERAAARGRRLRRRRVHRPDGVLLLAEGDFVAGLEAFDAADVDRLVALRGVHGQAGSGQAQDVEGLRRELRAGGDLDVGEGRHVRRVLADGPAGEVHVPVPGVVQFDEAVGDAELVDFHRVRAADLEAGALPAGGAGPGRDGLQVAVEGRGPGLDVELRDDRLAGLDGVVHRQLPVAIDGSLPALRQVQRQGETLDGLVGRVEEADHGLGGAAGHEGLHVRRAVVLQRREDLQRGLAVAGRDHIGLDGLVHLLRREGPGGGHRGLVEGAGGAVAVVAAVAQQDRALLAHGIVAAAVVPDATAVVIHLQGALLGVSAHRAPVVRLAVGGRRDEAPGDGLEALAELVFRVGIDTAHEVVLLVGHDPRARFLTMVPRRLVAEVGGFHRAVAVVAAVGLGVSVVEAATGIVVVAADHPVLALGLVIDGRAGGIVQAQAHARRDEQAVHLVAHHAHRRPVRHGNVVVPAHRGAAEAAARGLVQMVPLPGLVVQHRDPAIRVLAERVLRRRIGITARIVGRGAHHIDIQLLPVGLAHHLIQRPVVRRIQRPRGAVRRYARRSPTLIHIARPLGPRQRLPLVRQVLARHRRPDKHKAHGHPEQQFLHDYERFGYCRKVKQI